MTFSHYLYIGVQFSRGCPFTCEFCDIIELYGRAPRTKNTPQMLAELDRLLSLGFKGHVDFVDDNLIGNKKAIKLFLPHLIKWQEENGYPFKFSTEASLNLADDDELLAMMRDANFFVVFTGIETPDEATLIQTQKKQNTKRSIADSVHKLYEHGMFVTAGFIVGFDTEKDTIAPAMSLCIKQTSIPIAMVGLLYALPNTQLQRRLRKEGRLYETFAETTADQGDQCTQGLNFVTPAPAARRARRLPRRAAGGLRPAGVLRAGATGLADGEAADVCRAEAQLARHRPRPVVARPRVLADDRAAAGTLQALLERVSWRPPGATRWRSRPW